jgi:hypothetical protein
MPQWERGGKRAWRRGKSNRARARREAGSQAREAMDPLRARSSFGQGIDLLRRAIRPETALADRERSAWVNWNSIASTRGHI